MTAEEDWWLAGMRGGGIAPEDERMSCKLGNNAPQDRPLISAL